MEQLSEKDRIAHLLRRFGFGAGNTQLAKYEPLGYEGTLNRLLNYESVDEGFPVSPWEFCWDPKSTDAHIEAPRFAIWHSLRLCMTQRPLEMKLTIFWQNHLVAGADKVEFGPMMVDYLEAIRASAIGKFHPLLESVVLTPAILRYLDGDENFPYHPNENLGRELMELFTIGIGNYTEADVKGASRALTGLGIRYLIYEQGGNKVQQSIKEALASGEPTTATTFSPLLFDAGTKTVLNKTGPLDSSGLLQLLASRPETAHRLAKKIWAFFGSSVSNTSAENSLADKLIQTDGDIRAALKHLTELPEFWSEAQTTGLVKSPIDFVIPIVRQLGLDDYLKQSHPYPPSPMKPAPKPMKDVGGLCWIVLTQMGMQLLYPPNVSGWPWGRAWLSTNQMMERIKFASMLMGIGTNQHPVAGVLAARIMTMAPTTNQEAIHAMMAIFDARLPASKAAILATALGASGGLDALKSPDTAAKALAPPLTLLFGSPEFQYC